MEAFTKIVKIYDPKAGVPVLRHGHIGHIEKT